MSFTSRAPYEQRAQDEREDRHPVVERGHDPVDGHLAAEGVDSGAKRATRRVEQGKHGGRLNVTNALCQSALVGGEK